MRASLIGLLVGLSSSPGWAAGKAATGVCEKEFAGASKRYGVPVAVLTAVGMTETGRGDGLRPYALNINGDAVYDLSRNEAVLKFYEARQNLTALLTDTLNRYPGKFQFFDYSMPGILCEGVGRRVPAALALTD